MKLIDFVMMTTALVTVIWDSDEGGIAHVPADFIILMTKIRCFDLFIARVSKMHRLRL
jgi:hypothetical protein